MILRQVSAGGGGVAGTGRSPRRTLVPGLRGPHSQVRGALSSTQDPRHQVSDITDPRGPLPAPRTGSLTRVRDASVDTSTLIKKPSHFLDSFLVP